MKTFWKILGAAVLAVGFTPYHVEKDEKTGERKFQALLWQATTTPREGDRDALDINLGFKMPNSNEAEEEIHLFSDELCVEYTGAPVTETAAPEAPVEEEEPVEEKEPAAPVEEAPAEVPEEAAEAAEEDKDEA